MTTDTIDIWHNIIVKVLILLKNKDIYSITFIKKFNNILKYGIKKVRSDNGKTIKETIEIKIQFKIIDSKFIENDVLIVIGIVIKLINKELLKIFII